MAVHLAPTREELSPDLQAILGPPHDHHGKTLPVGGWYTCKNLDVETGDCLIYEERPYMCRDYPYDRKQGCQYPGCTRKCEETVT